MANTDEPAKKKIKPHRTKVLVFTKMMDYQHSSTPAAASWVLQDVNRRGWDGCVSDESSLLEDGSELTFDIIVLVNNSGEIFDPSSGYLKAHLDQGRAVLGIHAALATFLNGEALYYHFALSSIKQKRIRANSSPPISCVCTGEDASGATLMEPTTLIIQETFRAHFKNHPPVQEGVIVMNDKLGSQFSPSLGDLPSTFPHTDEFFNFTTNPCEDKDVNVLAYVDEGSYEGGLMGKSHPVVWHLNAGPKDARIFYCALGHFSHFYNDLGSDVVTKFLSAGLDFCAGGI